MTDEHIQAGRFAAIAQAYSEKIFYYCLKRTGEASEAEDLSQNIFLNVFSSLQNGAKPIHFSAWIWQIAHNCYSAWAGQKHDRTVSVTGSDIGDYEIEDKNGTPEERLIGSEQLLLLRRELSFIRSDYRNIVVAYYIEDRSVREIAAFLSLTESTVKQRLRRARRSLKEGMDMAREFGVLSYKPENIAFVMNGLQSSAGEPWNHLSRLLCKNILLAAYRTPATAEELAMEVGVALPYMEEELKSLVAATLMKKNGSRYETNFFIVSAEAQRKIYDHLRSLTSDLTQAVITALEFGISWKNENCPDWQKGYQPYEDMKWALLMREVDTIDFDARKPFQENAADGSRLGSWGHTVRPNGGEWDVLGMEAYSGEKPSFVGLHGCVASPSERDLPEIDFRQFKFQYEGIERQTPVTLYYSEAQALKRLADGEARVCDTELFQSLAKVGYVRQTEHGWEPNILVMKKARQGEMQTAEQNQLEQLRKKAAEIMARHYLFCQEVIRKETPDFLKEDEYQIQHACTNMLMFRGAVLEEALRCGYLYYRKEDPKRMLGAYILV